MKSFNKIDCRQLAIQIVLFFSACLFSFEPVRPQEKNSMLYWASVLVDHINADNTDYRHKETKVSWAGDIANDTYQSYTDCSGLINALLKRTYHPDDAFLKTWLGKARPLAYQYFDAIESGNHFKKIDAVTTIQPGDLLVIKYADRSEHEDNTGHCMLVVTAPELRRSTLIDKPGLDQYEVVVIDASKSPHGKKDTRYTSTGEQYAGTGKGVFRLYADKAGKLKGYSWSTGNPKPGFDPLDNPIVAGRIDIKFEKPL